MLATLLDHPYATAASVLATYLVSVFFYNLYIHRTRIAGLVRYHVKEGRVVAEHDI